MRTVGESLGVDLIVRVDHVARVALLVQDVGGLGLTVEHPCGCDQARLEDFEILYIVVVSVDSKLCKTLEERTQNLHTEFRDHAHDVV